ncbi:MAG: NUDIX domain-containing protein [Ruminiclostridium sp.]|nr:NUDIX domain-containing protein [Ruminiclostridium sp.]
MKADIIVKAIIFNRRLNRILLIQRSSNDLTGADTWENAGGNIEKGEQPKEAIKREIREETGITDIRIEKVAYLTLVNGNEPYLIIAYVCETQAEAVTLSSEHQAFIWADKEDCRNMLPQAITNDFEEYKIFDYLCDNMN